MGERGGKKALTQLSGKVKRINPERDHTVEKHNLAVPCLFLFFFLPCPIRVDYYPATAQPSTVWMDDHLYSAKRSKQ